MKRRILSLLLALVLIFSLAVPTFALSSTTTHKYTEGDRPAGNYSYHYECDTAASTSRASASMTYQYSGYSIEAKIAVAVLYGGEYFSPTPCRSTSYSSVSASINNTLNVNGSQVTGTITSATGTYYIAGYVVSSATVS